MRTAAAAAVDCSRAWLAALAGSRLHPGEAPALSVYACACNAAGRVPAAAAVVPLPDCSTGERVGRVAGFSVLARSSNDAGSSHDAGIMVEQVRQLCVEMTALVCVSPWQQLQLKCCELPANWLLQ